jgi:hypothetical protein
MSQPPEERGGGIRAVENEARRKRREEEREQHKTYRDIIAALNSIRDQLSTNDQQDHSDDNGKRFREFLTIILLIGTVLAAGWGDVIFYRTLVETAQSTVEVNRAWLNPVFMEMAPIVPNAPIRFAISYENSGHSPATNLRWNFAPGFAPRPPYGDSTLLGVPQNTTCNGLSPDDKGPSEFPITSNNVPANERGGHFKSWDTAGHIPPILADADMYNAKHFFFVQGCVVYRTMGIVGHSKFCFYAEAAGDHKTGTLAVCPGNGAD